MSASENIAKAKALKEEGNEAFKAGEYKKAMVAYHQIYMYVHGYSQGSGGGTGLPGGTTKSISAEEMAQVSSLKAAHFSNLAMCHLRLGNTEKARDCCTKAIGVDPNNVKARFRRGKCNSQLGALEDAREDLEHVLSLEPDNRDAMRELRELRSKLAQQRKKEQKKFAGFFDKLASMDTEGGGSGGAAGGAQAGESVAVQAEDGEVEKETWL